MRVPHKATLKSESEVTGAGMDAKRCRINNLSVKRKNGVFSKGEVFLHLTRPLMGDPIKAEQKKFRMTGLTARLE